MIIVLIAPPGEAGCVAVLEPWSGTSGTAAGSYAFSESPATVYKSLNITGLTGEWRVRMRNAGNEPVFTGYVVFSSDVEGHATSEPVSPALKRIEAKTTLLGTGQVAVIAMVSPTGEIASPIIIGDDYLEANGRAFEWTVPAVPGVVVGTAEFYFGGKPITGGNGWFVQGEVSDVGGGNWKVSAELPRTATSSLSEGQYRWSGEIRDASGNEVTRIRSDSNRHVQLVAKQT
jgi:hypothetical protein